MFLYSEKGGVTYMIIVERILDKEIYIDSKNSNFSVNKNELKYNLYSRKYEISLSNQSPYIFFNDTASNNFEIDSEQLFYIFDEIEWPSC